MLKNTKMYTAKLISPVTNKTEIVVTMSSPQQQQQQDASPPGSPVTEEKEEEEELEEIEDVPEEVEQEVEEEVENIEGAGEDVARGNTILKRMREQGIYSLYNPHAKYPAIFAIEPYIIFGLAVVISIIIVIRSAAQGEPFSKGLSAMWIVMSLYIIITTGMGTYMSEKVPEEVSEE